MSLQTNKQKGINLTRKIDAMAYLQKKAEIMPKQMKLRGKILYADCKFMGILSHHALVRNGSTFYTFKDGTQVSTWTNSSSIREGEEKTLANRGGSYVNGYVDELRVSKGIARWTSNFTPYTTAYGSFTASATGSFTSTTITPQDSSAKTSVGLVIL